MRIVIAAVGRPRGALAPAIAEYEKRAARYWPLTICEVREEPARSSSVDLVRQREAERLRGCARPGSHLVACAAEGEEMDSTRFAGWVQRERERADRDLVFILGGAYGLDPAFRHGMAATLSLSRCTLPHELARLVLAEQLYRAGSIVRGEPYHK